MPNTQQPHYWLHYPRHTTHLLQQRGAQYLARNYLHTLCGQSSCRVSYGQSPPLRRDRHSPLANHPAKHRTQQPTLQYGVEPPDISRVVTGVQTCALPISYILSIYFQEIKNYIALKIFNRCELMELIKINELIHLILYQPTSHIAQSLLQIIGHNRIEFVTHIRASLYRNVTIEQLANECGVSLSNFKLIFQRLFNCPPHHWFISNRLRSVCTLLEYTCQPIKEIANECGFSSPSHMIRLFRNHYGTTPTQYRATHNHHYSILKNTTILLK